MAVAFYYYLALKALTYFVRAADYACHCYGFLRAYVVRPAAVRISHICRSP